MGGWNLHADRVNFGDQTAYGLSAVTGSYGTVETIGTGKGSYEGYSINGHFVMMSNNNTTFGIYDDTANFWLALWQSTTFALRHNNNEAILTSTEDGAVYLYHNNVQRLATTSTGVSVDVLAVVNEIQLSGGSAGDPSLDWGGDTGFYEASNILSVSTASTRRAYWRAPTANGQTGTRNLGAFIVEGGSLGTTAGNIGRMASFGHSTGNWVNLEFQSIRNTGGSGHSNMALGIRRVTDSTSQSSLWFGSSYVGVNTSEPSKTLHVYGTVAARPGTTISQDAQWNSLGSSNYELTRNSSALKYKSEVSDASYLADVVLAPKRYLYHPEDGEGNRVGEPIWDYGFIADEIAAQGEHGKILGAFFEGEIDNYKTRGIMAVIAAKVNRLENKVQQLEEAA